MFGVGEHVDAPERRQAVAVAREPFPFGGQPLRVTGYIHEAGGAEPADGVDHPIGTPLARRIDDELGWCAVVPRLGEHVRLD